MTATPRSINITAEDLVEARRKRIAISAQKQNSAFRSKLTDEAQPYLELEGFATVWQVAEMAYLPQPPWLIEQFVEEDGFTLVSGTDKVGKTAVVSSFLWAWVAGRDHYLDSMFHMNPPSADRERAVVYLLLEGRASFYSRYAAWKNAYEIKEDLDNFFVITEGTSMFDRAFRPDDRDTWPVSLQNLWNTLEKIRPPIFVVDTFSRATAGIDENSSQVAQVVSFFDKLRDELGIATVAIHHTPVDPKTKRARGHGSLKAAASTHILIDGEAGQSHAKVVVQEHRNVDPKNPTHDGGGYGYYFKKTSYGHDGALLLEPVSHPGKVTSLRKLGSRPPSKKVLLEELVAGVGGELEVTEAVVRLESSKTSIYNIAKSSDKLVVAGGMIRWLSPDKPETL